MTVIDDFLKKIDEPQRAKVEWLRTIVKQTVPEAEEVISYGIPAFKYHGHAFFGFNLYKNHIGIYPFGGEVIEVMKDKLAKYKLAKGTVRIPLEEPIPENIIKQMIKYRIGQIDLRK